jgi:hypothetical protein
VTSHHARDAYLSCSADVTSCRTGGPFRRVPAVPCRLVSFGVSTSPFQWSPVASKRDGHPSERWLAAVSLLSGTPRCRPPLAEFPLAFALFP